VNGCIRFKAKSNVCTIFRLNERHFSLLMQKKSNQKKAHPASAPFALCAKGSFRLWGLCMVAILGNHPSGHRIAMLKMFPESFLDATSMSRRKATGIMPVALTGISPRLHRYGRELKVKASFLGLGNQYFIQPNSCISYCV